MNGNYIATYIPQVQCAENDDELWEIFTVDEALDLLYSTGYAKSTQNNYNFDRL